MSEKPMITVGGLVVAPDGELLLVRSKKWHELYSVPGGKVELGESREEALRREIWEETRLNVSNIRFATIQESIYSEEYWQKRHFVMNDYIVDLDPSSQKNHVVLNDEAYAYCWVDPREALSYPLHREAKRLISWYTDNILNRQIGIVGFHQHQINCIVGILPEERVIEQLLWVDLKVKIDFSRCLRSGSVDATVDYSHLASFCTNLSQEKCYGLIEAFAADIITGCFERFHAEWAWVCVRKPSAIPTAAYAFVEIEQYRK